MHLCLYEEHTLCCNQALPTRVQTEKKATNKFILKRKQQINLYFNNVIFNINDKTNDYIN